MTFSGETLCFLRDLSVEAARDAGAIIAGRAGGELAVERKAGGSSLASQVVTEVDRLAEAAILRRLEGTFSKYGIGLLTEEQPDDGSRFIRDAFWCIDPLDGTLPFTRGERGYAVSIALVSREGAALIGVVGDPSDGRVYDAVKGLGARRDGAVWRPLEARRPGDGLRVFGDGSFGRQARYAEVVDLVGAKASATRLGEVAFEVGGGAVMNAIWALSNPAACSFKFPKPERGGGSLWDFAATSCIVAEAGGVVSDMAGNPLELNRRESSFLNHCGFLFATDEGVAGCIRGVWTEFCGRFL